MKHTGRGGGSTGGNREEQNARRRAGMGWVGGMMWLAMLAAVVLRGRAAEYHVAPGGNSIGPGSERAPWGSIQRAVDAAAPGDTVWVHPGRYAERVRTVRDGRADGRITLRAMGGGVMTRGFVVRHDYVTLDGFHVSGDGVAPEYDGAIFVMRGADHGILTNNWIHDIPVHEGRTNRIYGIRFQVSRTPAEGARFWQVLNNVISNIAYVQMSLCGEGHRVAGNRFDRSNNRDALHVFGADHVISGNLFTNVSHNHPVVRDHTDIIQTFGDSEDWAWNIVFERNRIVNCEAQLCQLEQKGKAKIGKWVFRNNLWANVGMAGNVDIEDCDWLNNTFYRCTTNTAGPVMLNCSPKGCARRARVFNNLFIECGRDPAHALRGFYHADKGFEYEADYNFVAGSNGAPKRAKNFREAHGRTGGRVRWVDEAAGRFELLSENPDLPRGTNLFHLGFGDDLSGRMRPRDGAWDLGAFQR